MCDADLDGFAVFDLTSPTYFEGGQNPSDYLTPEYYISESDRDAQVNSISAPETYTNTMEGEWIFARANPVNPGIHAVVYKAFVLSTIWFYESIPNFQVCSESGNYNLDQLSSSLMCNNNLNNEVDLTFYNTLVDADSGTNAITVAISGKVYVRADSKTSNDYRISSFNLSVAQGPMINSPTPLEVCDDEIPDDVAAFDLSNKIPEIIGGLTGVEVTFHNTLSSANNNSSQIIDISTFVSSNSTVYVRVLDVFTGCVSITSLDLIVHDCSSKGVIEINAFYDENGNGSFDNDEDYFLNGKLAYEKNNDGIISDLYSSNGVFEIISDENDTYDISYALTSDYLPCYEVSTSYEAVSSAIGTTTILDLPIVKKSPDCVGVATANSPGAPFVCVENRLLDLYSFNDTALGSQNAENFTVSYYLNEADAENKINQLAQYYSVSYDDYFNPYPFFVRVEENISGSYDVAEFTAYPFHKPTVSIPTVYEVCDDSNKDGVAVFDLGSKSSEISNGQVDTFVWYYLTQEDAESQLNEIEDENNFVNTTPYGQRIYVRVENALNNSCYSEVVALDLVVIDDCSTRGIIEVNAFYDEDENTVFGNDEINFLNGRLTYEKNNDGILRVLHSSNGVFKIVSNDDNDTYDLNYSVINEFTGCYEVTTTSYNDISVSNGSTVSYNFPITKIVSCGDIAVYLVSNVPPRPGFDYKNYLVVRNKGIETVASGSVEFTMDATLTLNEVSGIGTGNSITNTDTGFIFDFVNLAPNQSERVRIEMNVPIPTPLGALLTNTATYSVTDLSVDNNTSTLSEVVIGSYDPNDINESHGPEILYDSFTTDDYLFYTIRFQNVGTADAINVSIDNTLDEDLDESTIQMLSSSHTNVFTRTGSDLNWQFDNIHLPSEDMDEPNSHGYVYYKIKPKAGYSIDDVIPNTAEIYFDFNPAVVTNTFETEFTTTLSSNKNTVTKFTLLPNPADDFIELNFENPINDFGVKIYDIQGKLVLASQNSTRINVSGLRSGLYFIELESKENKLVKKLIIK